MPRSATSTARSRCTQQRSSAKKVQLLDPALSPMPSQRATRSRKRAASTEHENTSLTTGTNSLGGRKSRNKRKQNANTNALQQTSLQSISTARRLSELPHQAASSSPLSSDCEKTQPRLRKRRSGTPGNISADELERPVATNETVLLEIAELRRRAERAEAGWREEENKRRRAEESRKQAETRAEEYRRQAETYRPEIQQNRPLPRPQRPRSANWQWARLEDILGLSYHPDRRQCTPIELARSEIYHWIQHVSRWVLNEAHRKLNVETGAWFRSLDAETQKTPMLNEFRKQVRQEPFLWHVFYYPGPVIDGLIRPGSSKFQDEWPMEELLLRSMKNERDALQRPYSYAKRIREDIEEAELRGDNELLFSPIVIRRDTNGNALGGFYDLAHDINATGENLTVSKTSQRRSNPKAKDQASIDAEKERQKAIKEAERQQAIQDVQLLQWNAAQWNATHSTEKVDAASGEAEGFAREEEHDSLNMERDARDRASSANQSYEGETAVRNAMVVLEPDLDDSALHSGPEIEELQDERRRWSHWTYSSDEEEPAESLDRYEEE